MHGFGLVCVCVSIRFSSERSPDLAAHSAEHHDITSTDAQRGVREGTVFCLFLIAVEYFHLDEVSSCSGKKALNPTTPRISTVNQDTVEVGSA